MRIEEDIKLDYNNVLIRPKRSTLGSRKEVDLERGFTFRGKCKHTTDVLTRVEAVLDDRSPQYRWEYT